MNNRNNYTMRFGNAPAERRENGETLPPDGRPMPTLPAMLPREPPKWYNAMEARCRVLRRRTQWPPLLPE